MFSRVSRFFQASIHTTLSNSSTRVHSPGFLPTTHCMLFSTSNYEPHSDHYLSAQKEMFEKHNISVSLSSLPKGTTLFGLNTNEIKPYSMGGIPVYSAENRPRFSPAEQELLLQMKKDYFAKTVGFKLAKDTNCIVSQTENNFPVYHVAHGHLIREDEIELDELFNNNDALCPKI